MGHTPCLASDKSALGDHQRARLTSTLTIVLNGEVAVDVLGIGTNSCKRGEDDAVQVQLFMKDVSIVRLYIPGAETQDSCESCEYASKTPC